VISFIGGGNQLVWFGWFMVFKLTITKPNICAEDIKEIEDCNTGPCIMTSKFKIFTTLFFCYIRALICEID
jgi:hypothetical protein